MFWILCFQVVPYPSLPRQRKPRCGDLYYSSWCIQACIFMLHSFMVFLQQLFAYSLWLLDSCTCIFCCLNFPFYFNNSGIKERRWTIVYLWGDPILSRRHGNSMVDCKDWSLPMNVGWLPIVWNENQLPHYQEVH